MKNDDGELSPGYSRVALLIALTKEQSEGGPDVILAGVGIFAGLFSLNDVLKETKAAWSEAERRSRRIPHLPSIFKSLMDSADAGGFGEIVRFSANDNVEVSRFVRLESGVTVPSFNFLLPNADEAVKTVEFSIAAGMSVKDMRYDPLESLEFVSVLARASICNLLDRLKDATAGSNASSSAKEDYIQTFLEARFLGAIIDFLDAQKVCVEVAQKKEQEHREIMDGFRKDVEKMETKKHKHKTKSPLK